jgi:hypothetical protein
MLRFSGRPRPSICMTTAHNNLAFMAQETLDVWLAEERVSLDGEVLKLLPDGPAFLLTTAVYFQAEVSTGEDPNNVVGRAKAHAEVKELGGEHAPGSVVMGDNAYEVRDGFLGELLLDHPEQPGTSGKQSGGTPASTSQRDPGREALQALSALAGEAG